MSYILDALKKIEHEKNKKIRPPGRVNISGDLFQERKQPDSRTSRRKVATLVIVASLVTCAGTWLVLKGGSKKVTAVTRPLPLVSAPSISRPSESVAPSVPPPSPPQSIFVAPAVLPTSKKKDADANGALSGRKEIRTESRPVQQAPEVKQPTQLIPAPADIKLAGIAWQDERAARRAVVNGFLLKEGSVVSGATIMEIQAAKVRFMSAAGQFEITLDTVLPAGGVR